MKSSNKYNLNIKKTIKILATIALSIVAVLIMRMYWIPKDMVFGIVIYMLIYVFIGLIIESIFPNKDEN